MRYCKSTIFQANHNSYTSRAERYVVVCDTAKVRFFKQITTVGDVTQTSGTLFAILQKYDFSSKSQRKASLYLLHSVVCDTAKVRFFKQITTRSRWNFYRCCCLRYCKSTIFQANHNGNTIVQEEIGLFAILQKYDFSSKSQQTSIRGRWQGRCLRYCKSTIFQANHNNGL